VHAVDAETALERFYLDVLWELGEFARRKSATAIGAAAVVKRVGLSHGVRGAESAPLPRLTRAEREDQVPWNGDES
jgi:hypothetical protein